MAIEPVPLSATISGTEIKINTSSIKTAPIDTILFDDESVPVEIITDLVFEDIGGQEIINIARNDIINGQKISYSPIKNIASVQQQYNPNNILSIFGTSDKYFSNFSIKFENKVVAEGDGSGPNGEYVYINSDGDLIVEVKNVEADEQIEVQVGLGGTIYTSEFNES